MNLVVANLLTHYERVKPASGPAKLLVIIPGWADTSASWKQVQLELGTEYDTVVVDLPGFGGSQKPAATWGLDEYAGFVREFILKLNTGPAYAIIGHSNGGAIAIRGLATNVLTSTKLILIGCAGIRGHHAGRKSLLKIVTKAGKAITSPLPKGTKLKLRKVVYQKAGSDMLVAEHMTDSFKKVVATDVQQDASTIILPTLLLYGNKDTDTPLQFGEIYQSLIKKSQLKVVPDAGHFVFIDRPTEVLTEIKAFLND